MRTRSSQYPVASSQGRGWIQSIVVFFVLVTPAVAQAHEPEAITLYAGEKLAEWLKGPRVGPRLEGVRTGGIVQRLRALEAK